MDWAFVVYGGIFFFGLVLCVVKLFYMFQNKTKGYMNLCVQYSTGTTLFVSLIGTLGILAARLSNASGEIGVDIFLLTLIVYLITAVSFCFIAICIEICTSLLRRGKVNVFLRLCLGLIILSPISISGIVIGLSAKEGQLVGTCIAPMAILIVVISSIVFLVGIFRKAKLLANAISPVPEQQNMDKNDVVVNFPKGSGTINSDAITDERQETNNNKILVRQSLRSNLKKTDERLRDGAHRSVCFLIGIETEIWHKEKEFRRIEKERGKAVLFLAMFVCFSVCFLPFGFVLLYHGTFSIHILACRIAYVPAVLFTVIEPITYMLCINYQASNA